MRSILGALGTVFLTVSVVFFMVRAAPGGPFDAERALSAAQRELLQKNYGLDRPVGEQFAQFWAGVLRGEWGRSLVIEGKEVSEIIAQAFPVSLGVGTLALVFAVGAGVPLGFWGALKGAKGRWVFVFALLPSFVAAPLVQQVVLALGGEAWGFRGWGSLVLPALVLGLYYLPFVARLTQEGFAAEGRALYLRLAQAKGLTRKWALFRHGAAAALSPVVAYLAPAAAGLITGSFVVETVWGLPGLGRFFVNAVFSRDDTLILGLVAFFTTILVAFNWGVERILERWNPAAFRAKKEGECA